MPIVGARLFGTLAFVSLLNVSGSPLDVPTDLDAPPQERAYPRRIMPAPGPVFPMGTVPHPMGVFPMAAQWPPAFPPLAPTQPTTQPSEKVPEVVQESLTIAILNIVKDPDGLSWLIKPANIHMVENLLQSACSNNYSPACRENLSYIMYALSNDPDGRSWLKEPNNACMVKKVLGLLINDDNTFACQDNVAWVSNKLSEVEWIAKL